MTDILETWNKKREEAHRTFSGVIIEDDFNTSYPSGHIIDHIAGAFKCDERCNKNIYLRNQYKKAGKNK